MMTQLLVVAKSFKDPKIPTIQKLKCFVYAFKKQIKFIYSEKAKTIDKITHFFVDIDF